VLAVHLAHALGATRRPIKAALLDQRVIAGVGNIYADEALFRARVRPALPADAVPTRSVGRLARHLTDVLSAAVEARGSSLRDYADADGRPGTAQLTHAVYGRAGQPCVACGHPLRSAQLAQRTTVWCETCQPG
jgi:formamidopyrimidine-DNA glycosylase